jgi:hypothetical protein
MSYIILTEPFKTCDPPRGNVFYTPAYGCLSPLKYAKRYATFDEAQKVVEELRKHYIYFISAIPESRATC